eukprot:118036_1
MQFESIDPVSPHAIQLQQICSRFPFLPLDPTFIIPSFLPKHSYPQSHHKSLRLVNQCVLMQFESIDPVSPQSNRFVRASLFYHSIQLLLFLPSFQNIHIHNRII